MGLNSDHAVCIFPRKHGSSIKIGKAGHFSQLYFAPPQELRRTLACGRAEHLSKRILG